MPSKHFVLIDSLDQRADTAVRVMINANASELVTRRIQSGQRPAEGELQKAAGHPCARNPPGHTERLHRRANFVLNKDRNELRLNDLRLRFDTTLWASTQPAGIHWGPRGVDVERLELRNTRNGRIFVNGLLPRRRARRTSR